MTAVAIGVLTAWHITIGITFWLLWRREARLRVALDWLASCADDAEKRWRAGAPVLHMDSLRFAIDGARRALGRRGG